MAEKSAFLDDLKIQKLCASVQWKHSVQSHFSKAMVTNTSPTDKNYNIYFGLKKLLLILVCL